MSPRKPHRVRWEVLPSGRPWYRWKVTRNGVLIDTYAFKWRAIEIAVGLCNWEWDSQRIPSELLIKDKDGKVQDPRTYGRDPRESKG